MYSIHAHSNGNKHALNKISYAFQIDAMLRGGISPLRRLDESL